MEHRPRRVVTGHDADGKSIIALDDTPETLAVGGAADRRALTEVWATVANGADGASEFRLVDFPPGGRRAMHRTDTVDFGLVLAGEIYLVLERAETLLRAGDVVVQRGTNHAWHNRSGHTARLAFVNLRGQASDPARSPDV